DDAGVAPTLPTPKNAAGEGLVKRGAAAHSPRETAAGARAGRGMERVKKAAEWGKRSLRIGKQRNEEEEEDGGVAARPRRGKHGSDGPTRLVITLDGGGVRGITTLRFLVRVEDALRESLGSGFRLREVVDLWCGTSAGAMIAAAFARTSVAAHELEGVFDQRMLSVFNKSLCDRIFGRTQAFSVYDGVGKREMIEEILNDPEEKFFEPEQPKLMVTAFDLTDDCPVVFKSWSDKPRNREATLAGAIDASSSLPVFFPSTEMNGHKYIDGGILSANPSDMGFTEAVKLFPGEKLQILSIGCGENPHHGFDTKSHSYFAWIPDGSLAKLILDTQLTVSHGLTQRLANLHDHKYLRVNSLPFDEDLPSADETGEKDMLRALGDAWFEEFGQETVRVIEDYVNRVGLELPAERVDEAEDVLDPLDDEEVLDQGVGDVKPRFDSVEDELVALEAGTA
ncbi:Patatin-like protein 2 (OsPLP2), partial [Durusdinium trenchii]